MTSSLDLELPTLLLQLPSQKLTPLGNDRLIQNSPSATNHIAFLKPTTNILDRNDSAH